MFCKFCGKQIDDEARFCSQCGAVLDETSANNFSSPSVDSTSNRTVYPNYGIFPKIISFVKNWKHCMIINFVLWGMSILLFFCNWFKITIYEHTAKYTLISTLKQIEEWVAAYNTYSYNPNVGVAADATVTNNKIIIFFTFIFICASVVCFLFEEKKKSSIASILTSISIAGFAIYFLNDISSSFSQNTFDSMLVSFFCDTTASPYLIIAFSIISCVLSVYMILIPQKPHLG